MCILLTLKDKSEYIFSLLFLGNFINDCVGKIAIFGYQIWNYEITLEVQSFTTYINMGNTDTSSDLYSRLGNTAASETFLCE